MVTGKDPRRELHEKQYALIEAEPDYSDELAKFGQEPFVYDVVPRYPAPQTSLEAPGPLPVIIGIGDTVARLATDQMWKTIPYINVDKKMVPGRGDILLRARRDLTRIIIEAGEPNQTPDELMDQLERWDEVVYPRRILWRAVLGWWHNDLVITGKSIVQFTGANPRCACVNRRLALTVLPFADIK